MRSMKKVLSLLLVLSMIFAMVPSFAMAEDGPVQIAGYTPDNGTEIVFYADTSAQADDVDNNIYTTAEKAFAAAQKKWAENLTGTVDLYDDVTISDKALFNNSTTNGGVFYATGYADGANGGSLTLNLHGNTITAGDALKTKANSARLISLDQGGASYAVTINGKDANGAKNGAIVWDSYYSMIYTKNATVPTITLNNVDVSRNASAANETATNKDVNGNIFTIGSTEGTVTLNGGTWKLYEADGYQNILGFPGSVGARTGAVNYYLTGGIEIYSTAARVIRVGSAGKVYVVDAVVYSAADDNAVAGDGFGIASVANRTNDAYEGDFVALGDGNGNYSEMTVGTGTTFDGAAVRALTVKPSTKKMITVDAGANGTVVVSHEGMVEAGTEVTVTVTPDEGYVLQHVKVNGTNVEVTEGTYTFTLTENVDISVSFAEYVAPSPVVKYTSASGEETTFYVGTSSDANVFFTVEEAFIAAKNLWKETEYGIVDIYADIEIATPSAYDSMGIFYAAAKKTVSLTLNLNGHTLTSVNSGAKKYAGTLFRIDSTTAESRTLIINGRAPGSEQNGLLSWGAERGVMYEKAKVGSTTNIVFNHVDIIREDGGDSPANGNIIAPNSPNIQLTINGGNWELRKGANSFAYKVAHTGSNSGHVAYITGGAVIKTTATDLIDIGGTTGRITAYVDDATIYTSASDEILAGEGKGIVGVGIPTVVWGNAAGETALISVGASETFCGATVRPMTIYPSPLNTIGSADKQEDSVVYSAAAKRYYSLDELKTYFTVPGKAADTLTAVADFDMGDALMDVTSELTLDLTGFVVTGKLSVSADTVIAGGTLKITQPINVADGAMLKIANGVVIDASSLTAGTVVTGTGTVIVNVAQFAVPTAYYNEADLFAVTLTAEYGTVETEVVDANTVVTFTSTGSTEQADNTILLVESNLYFNDLATAVDAASSVICETVKLLGDASGNATVTKDVIFDLNGFAVDGTITVNSGNVEISGGALSAAADVLTVNGGTVAVEGLTVVSNENALVVDGAATVTVTDTKLYGDADGADAAGYAANVVAATKVTMTNVDLFTGSTTAAVVSATCDDNVFALISGRVYVPDVNFETKEWAVGVGVISTSINTTSRYTYDAKIPGVSGSSRTVVCYVLEAVDASEGASYDVAKIGNVGYLTFTAALSAAVSGNEIVLLKDVVLRESAAVPAGVTLNLDGYTLATEGAGALTVNGTVVSNGGAIETAGGITFAVDSSYNDYTFAAEAKIHSGLKMSAMSLSLNNMVAVNMKFMKTDLASFTNVAVTCGNKTVVAGTDTETYNVFTAQNFTAAEYYDVFWAVCEGTVNNVTYIGLPTRITIDDYVLAIIGDESYGYASDLGKTLTAMMDLNENYDDVEAMHTVNTAADYGTQYATVSADSVITATVEDATVFTVKFTATAGGTMSVTYTDVFGEVFTVTGEGTVEIDLHAADAAQMITATLGESVLETSFGTIINGTNDEAMLYSNHAAAYFTGA